MRIYISGISGTGMGPLALLAKAAGIVVAGSDLHAGPVLAELEAAGIAVAIGAQDGEFLRKCLDKGEIDWFVYTSALPEDHAELAIAKEAGIRVSKRDEFLAWLIDEFGLKLVAVAGTHGKTTTTSMLIWASVQLGLPAAWLVGTTLPFAGAASYRGEGRVVSERSEQGAGEAGDRYFIYEADEYDRNFLAFKPWVAVIPFVSYDHPDIYATQEEYLAAFDQFRGQSAMVIEPSKNPEFKPEEFVLAGEARRIDAALAAGVISKMAEDYGVGITHEKIVETLNNFPGTGRRFEKIAEGVYSDYAHHPEEIRATIEMAGEEAERTGRRGVVAIYEPHQNIRQHEVFSGYHDAFLGAEKVVWLPTYLVREDPELKVITPEEFVASLDNAEVGEAGEMGEELAEKINQWANEEYLVLLMTAGPADEWLRGVMGTRFEGAGAGLNEGAGQVESRELTGAEAD